MTTSQIDALVATNIGCSAVYVQMVRLQPSKYKSTKAQAIREELERVNSIYVEAKERARR